MSVLRRLWAWLRGLLAREPRVDTSVYQHVYIGPTRYPQLPTGARVRVLGKGHRDQTTGHLGRGGSGGRRCVAPDGREWLLATSEIERRP